MKTLYSSTFISIVLAFLMYLGYTNQPIDIVQNPDPLQFSYLLKQEEPTASEGVRIEIFDDLTSPTEFIKNTLPKIRVLEQENDEIELYLYFIPNINDWLLYRAAMSLKCAGDQDQFWAMYEKLHEQKDNLSKWTYNSIAKELKLDMDAFQNCKDEEVYKNAIEEDVKYASEKNIIFSPTILINEYKLIGNQPFENVQKVINEILKEDLPAIPIEIQPTDLEQELENPEVPDIELTI